MIFGATQFLCAQQDDHRIVQSGQIVLQRQGAVYQQDLELTIPLESREPFTTFTMKLFHAQASEVAIEIAHADESGLYSTYYKIGFEEHGPFTDEFKVTELVFLPNEVAKIRIRITAIDHFSIPVEYHYFRPRSEYLLEEAILPAPVGRLGCDLPGYVTRTGWNCPDGQDFSSGTPSFTNVSHLVVHHSAGANSSNNWPAVVLSIWNYHRFTNGWSDIGYNFLIDPDGNIYEGRGGNDGYALDVLPAATCGSNSGTMAVCLLGNFEEVSPQEDAMASLETLLAWKAQDRSIDATASSTLNNYGIIDHVFGHRQGCSTACPGENLFTRLPQLRLDIADEVITLCALDPANVVYVHHTIDDNNDGESVGDDDGVVEAGETIEIYLTLENVGGENASNVTASLATTVSCVSFIDATISYGDLLSGEVKTEGDFDIVFASECEDQIIPFVLTISSDDSTWYDTIYIELFNNCKPVAIIEADPDFGPVPLVVTYSSQSVNADFVEWNFPGPGVTPPAVSGLETVEVTYSQPGDFDAILTAYNECGSDVVIYSITVDVISSVAEEQVQFKHYPNPVHDRLHIEFNQFITNGETALFNTVGQQLLVGRFTGNHAEISMESIATGIYVIHVSDIDNGITWSARVVKE